MVAAKKFDFEERLSQIPVEALIQLRDLVLLLQMRTMEEVVECAPSERDYIAGRAKACKHLVEIITSHLSKRK